LGYCEEKEGEKAHNEPLKDQEPPANEAEGHHVFHERQHLGNDQGGGGGGASP